jgi:hypothetical protein
MATNPRRVMLRLGEASPAGTRRDASADLSMTHRSYFVCQYRPWYAASRNDSVKPS